MTAGGALTAALIPQERRGEGLAFVGLVGGVPALLALPLGPWAVGHWGYESVFMLLVVAGAATFGVGFGVLQNATLSLTYARVPAAGYGAVSALWNAAYDVGMGAGAIAVGFLVAGVGFGPAFLLTAASMLPALVPARRESEPEAELPHAVQEELCPVPA